ncbi:MAG: hypothetical protein M1822_003629 [Bathelium mastoideum]|nr:MAG: hypothetical protein M1822_003629 [Bathelium mastoideum]
MDGANGYPRSRNPSNLSAGSGGLAGEDVRREAGGSQPRNASSTASMTRAERFEDEKKRIIESCFSKVDINGQRESYITHIRVQEDSAYPSNPPPPNSPAENKKPRVIIISVRNTGRVRMHKARENSNTSFSIGKTWNLEDLTAVELFGGGVPASPEEARRKQWAGPVGFIVTIAKPYYWQAGTAKEKEFFIGSLVKIYRKYTQGRIPELTGFDPQEQEQILGGIGQQNKGNRQPPPPPPADGSRVPSRPKSPPSLSNGQPGPTGDPYRRQARPNAGSRTASGSEESQRYQAYYQQSSEKAQRPAPLQSQQGSASSLQPRAMASQERIMRQRPSRDQMRPAPSPAFSSGQRLTPESSHSELGGQRSISPEQSSVSSRAANGGPGSIRTQSPKMQFSQKQDQGNDEPATEATTPNGANLFMSAVDRFKPQGAAVEDKASAMTHKRPPPSPNASNLSIAGQEGAAPEPEERKVPERRRPPMAGGKSDGGWSQTSDRSADVFSTPMTSPSTRKDGGSDSNAQETKAIEEPEVPGSRLRPAPLGLTGRTASEPGTKGAAPSDGAVTPTGETNAQDSPSSAPDTPAPETPGEQEVFRPGLGPMIKKKARGDAATFFRKAAAAHNAFKPRSGGAGSKLSANDLKSPNEPDGISAVVPAPSLTRTLSSPSETSVTEKTPTTQSQEQLPQVQVSSPEKPTAPDADQLPTDTAPAESPENLQRPSVNGRSESTESLPPEFRRRKRRSMQHTKYLTMLNIDSNLLEGKGLNFEAALGDFGWGNNLMQSRKLEAMEADVRRELGRVEAGSWLGHLEQKDDRVETVEKMLDKAIAECEEFEALLTLYGVELSSLNDDVAFIEAQSQGLQVQTANQKLLQNELEHLVDTISIREDQLEPLRRAPIESTDGLAAIESSLLLLYKAMVTIDPAMRQANDVYGSAAQDADRFSKSSANGLGGSELSGMRALQEKRVTYLHETSDFLERFKQAMDSAFKTALASTSQNRANGIGGTSNRLDLDAHESARSRLWQYSPLLLFAKEIDRKAWENLLQLYQFRARGIYQDQCRENSATWKKTVRKQVGDDHSVLFTSQEKEAESLSGTARKLTVKRSQTLAKSFRNTSGEKSSTSADKNQIGRLQPSEAFAGALNEMIPLIFREQNFVVDFFHATSLETSDFADVVAMVPPHARYGSQLQLPKQFEPDRAMAKRIVDVMDDLYSFWPAEVQSLVDWALSSDPLQGIGLLGFIERRLLDFEDTNQDFLNKALTKIHERLAGLFNRFVDEQTRAIEDTKVKIKKRKGVIAFIRTFPNFCAAIENMLPTGDGAERLEIRNMVDEAYQKINKSMFDSLKVIAKESPAARVPGQVQGIAVQSQGVNDPEDKEALNYHILLIENMNHYMEEVDDRASIVIAEWKKRAATEMQEHMEAYVNAVIRRPLGKVLDFLESTELLLQTMSPQELAQRPSHSRSVFKKLMSNYDAKEIRRGVDALRKRVEKHFGEADDPNISRKLVGLVLEGCQARYEDTCQRLATIGRDVYDGSVEMDWGADDVRSVFRT